MDTEACEVQVCDGETNKTAKVFIFPAESIDETKRKIVLQLELSENIQIVFANHLLLFGTPAQHGITKGSVIKYYVMYKQRLSLPFLSFLIRERTEHNRELVAQLRKTTKKVFYPFGYTGGGMYTAFIERLTSRETPAGTFEAAGEVPEALKSLVIGQSMKSQTVFISATAHDNYIFLDGPGSGDTGGAAIDISNVVALSQVMEVVPQLSPVVFVEYLQLATMRGSLISKLLGSLVKMFNEEVDLLEKHMIVIITKVPPAISPSDILMKVEDLAAQDTEENTLLVKELLNLIVCGLSSIVKKNPKLPMAGRVVIFKPQEASETSRKIRLCLGSTPQISNPKQYFTTKIDESSRLALVDSLHELEGKIPVWLKEGDSEKLTEHLLLLKDLATCLPEVGHTLKTASQGLHQAVSSKLGDGKEFLHMALQEGVIDPDISKFTDARQLLCNVEPLRDFMKDCNPPLDTVASLDSWTVEKLTKLETSMKASDNYERFGQILKKFKHLALAFSYLPDYNDIYERCRIYVQSRVQNLKERVEKVKLSPAMINQVHSDLQGLIAATEKVQPFLSFNCKDLIDNAIITINKSLDEMVAKVIRYVQNKPQEKNDDIANDFLTIKLICAKKGLANILNEVGDSLRASEEAEDDLSFSMLTTSQATSSKIGTPAGKCLQRFIQIKDESIRCAKEAITQLKSVAGKTEGALEMENEKYVKVVQAICSIDKSVQDAIGMEFTQAIFSMEQHVDALLTKLKNVVGAQTPQFALVPSIFKELQGCQWLDKYTFNPNRIQQKMEEAIKELNNNLHNYTNKVKNCYIKSDYKGTEERFINFEENLASLASVLPKYEEEKLEITTYLKNEIKSVYSFGETKMSLRASSHFSFTEGDQYLGKLASLYSLAVTVGLKEDHEMAKKMCIRYFKDNSKRMVEDILASKFPYDWKSFNHSLNQLQPITSRSEYPNFDDEIRKSYEKAVTHCKTKFQELKSKAGTCAEDNPSEMGALIENLQMATILAGHIENLHSDISTVLDSRMKSMQSAQTTIQAHVTQRKYREALLHLDSKLKPSGTDSPSTAYKNTITLIKSAYVDAHESLKKTVCFYKVFLSTEQENQSRFNTLLGTFSDFSKFNTVFLKSSVNDDESIGKDDVKNMYELLDNKIVAELEDLGNNNLNTDMGSQEVSTKISFVEKLITTAETTLGKTFATKSKESATKLRKRSQESWNTLLEQINNPEVNMNTIDNAYESFTKEGSTKAGDLKRVFTKNISQLVPSNTASLSEIKESHKKLQRMQSQTFHSDLRKILADTIASVAETERKLDKEKSMQFNRYLETWDLAKIQEFFSANKLETDLIDNATQRFTEAARLLQGTAASLKTFGGIEQFCGNLAILSKISASFPNIVPESTIQDQNRLLKGRASTKIDDIKEVFVTVGQRLMSLQIDVLSQAINELAIFAQFKDIVPNAQMQEVIGPVVAIFGKNKVELDSTKAKYEFHNIASLLGYFREVDLLLSGLRNLQKHLDVSFSVIHVTLANVFDYKRAVQEIVTWISQLSSEVEKMWHAKSFDHVYKVLKAINYFNPQALAQFFPINEQVDSIFKFVNSSYDEITSKALAQINSESWADFRSSLSTLEQLKSIEEITGKNLTHTLKMTIDDKIQAIKNNTNSADRKSVCHSLVELNQLSLDIPQFKIKADTISAEIISEYGSGNDGDEKIYELGLALSKSDGPRARNAKDVVASFKQFSAVNMKARQEATVKQTIEWALGFWGDSFDVDSTGTNTIPVEKRGIPRFLYTDSFPKDKSAKIWDSCVDFCKNLLGIKGKDIIAKYDKFKKLFDELYDKSILEGIPEIVNSAKQLFNSKLSVGRKLEEILAHICVVWSRLKTSQTKGKSTKNTAFRLVPHPIQVLCFFRLLEHSPSDGYYSQLIEVLTGEGKSVVLGIVATYFALLGFDVYCICYSKYLSLRDLADFIDVFDEFGVRNKIVYSTIAEMCEHTINRSGSVRDLTKSVIESGTKQNTNSAVTLNPNRVLLIDEVDVFFGSDFYGNYYNPATLISNDDTFEILQFIYNFKDTVTAESVLATPHFQELAKKFDKLKPLMVHEIRKMVEEVKKFEDTQEKPVVVNDVIYYKDQDTISCKKTFGYKTCFQYFSKWEDGDITEQSVRGHVGMYIGCGNFSFAEIPGDFTYKIGVSGTLQSLTKEEKEIIQGYGIQRLAYAPSIFGGSRCNASAGGKSQITFYEPATWFLNITQAIGDKIAARRAVLVFFETIEVLKEFSKYLTSKNLKHQILSEDEEFKESVVKQSTATETITLCTRVFGRGVDFIVRDPKTKDGGGVHVIQTFIATSEAEQIQIKGRAARQGDPGSHEFILSHPYLKKYYGTTEGQPQNSGFENFDHDNQLTRQEKEDKMNKLRDVLYGNQVKELGKRREKALEAHKLTKAYYKSLLGFDGTPEKRDEVISMLMEINKGNVTSAGVKYHLYFCLDESFSMKGQPWTELLDAVSAFISKRIECCNTNGCPVQDLVTVVNYSTDARVVIDSEPITTDLVQHITFKGGLTNFSAGLSLVMDCITNSSPQTSGFVPCVVFMSDGGCAPGNGTTEMASIIQQYPTAQVFVIGFGAGCNRPTLTELADLGKGTFYFSADGAQLKDEFKKVSETISGGYYVN